MRLLTALLLSSMLSACASDLARWPDAVLRVRAHTDNGRCRVQTVYGPTVPEFSTTALNARINGKDAWFQMQGEARHRSFSVSTGNSFDVGPTGFSAETRLEAELDAAETLEIVLEDGATTARLTTLNPCKLNQFTLEGDAARQYRAGERFTLVAHPSASWNTPLAFGFSQGSDQTVPLVGGRAELTVPMNASVTTLLVWPEASASLPTPSVCEGVGSCVVEEYSGYQHQSSVSVLVAP